MKKLRNLIAVMAVMSMAAVLTGCGDDDDDDDDNSGPNNPPLLLAPASEAELTAQNKTYTLNVSGQADPITLTFPAAGQYQTVQGSTTETGAISGAQRDFNTWTVNVTPTAGQQGAQEGVLRLDFSSAQAGTFTFTPTGGQPDTGTFTIATTGGTTDGSTNGNTDGSTTPGVQGKTLQINYPNGGGEKFQFVDATNVSYENGTNTGIYTYDEANRRVNVTLNNGWLYEITLGNGTNQATVVFKQNAGDPGNTDSATYTLQ